MGLPKPDRLPKNAKISVEDMYKQRDYRTPTGSKPITTIFDVDDPKSKGGSVQFSKAKRKRLINFPENPEDRKVRYLPFFGDIYWYKY